MDQADRHVFNATRTIGEIMQDSESFVSNGNAGEPAGSEEIGGEKVTGDLGGGKKDDTGKPALGKLPERALMEVGRVLRFGSDKYDPSDLLHENNWRQGMPYSRLIASAMRHLTAFKQGDDRDDESGLSHVAHAATCCMMLEEMRHIFPQGDDRDHMWRRRTAYVLDIDGVIADFLGAFYAKAREMGLVSGELGPETHSHWQFPFDDEQVWDAIDIEDFYLNRIEPHFDGRDLPIEPFAYLTHRPCSTETTQRWLLRHNFPNAPVVTVEDAEGKGEAIGRIAEEAGERPITVVDDRFANFRVLNNEGYHCLLYDRPHNRHAQVGDYRISSLGELNQDPTYS